MKDLQKILNNYLLAEGYRLPAPISVKFLQDNKSDLIILNHIPDHRGDYLQLFLTMDAKGHYLLSDGGYIQKELALLEENWEGFTDKADNEQHYRCEDGRIICSSNEEQLPETICCFFDLLRKLHHRIGDRIYPQEDILTPFDVWAERDFNSNNI